MDTNTKNIQHDEFINFIFNNPPKPLKTVNLEFPDNNLKDLFENLLDIFTQGMKIKYGENNKVDLSKLQQKNIIEFNKYFNSFGINLNIEIEPYNIFNNEKYESLRYNKILITKNTKLQELKLPFLSNNIVYLIYFNYI